MKSKSSVRKISIPISEEAAKSIARFKRKYKATVCKESDSVVEKSLKEKDDTITKEFNEKTEKTLSRLLDRALKNSDLEDKELSNAKKYGVCSSHRKTRNKPQLSKDARGSELKKYLTDVISVFNEISDKRNSQNMQEEANASFDDQTEQENGN